MSMCDKKNINNDGMILVPKEFIAELESSNANLAVEFKKLKAMYNALARQVFGYSSERVLDDEDTGDIKKDTIPEESSKDEAELSLTQKRKNGCKAKKKNGGGRKAVEEDLPYGGTEFIPLPDHMILDENGNPYDKMGFRSSFVYDIIEAKITRREIKRVQYGDNSTGEVKIVAPVKSQIVTGGKFSDEFIFYVIYSKFIMGLPLYRQSGDFNRQGAAIGTSILSDAVKNFSVFFAGIVLAILNEIKDSGVVHIDETTMKEFALKYNKQKYIWLLTEKRGNIYCHYGGRKHDDLREIFGLVETKDTKEKPEDEKVYHKKVTKETVIVTDAYSAYDTLEKEVPEISKAGCLAHARRKFFDAGEGMKHREEIIGIIKKLYKVESNAKKHCSSKEMDEELRIKYYTKTRQAKSKPIMKKLEKKLLKVKKEMPKNSTIVNACDYMLTRWDEFEKYLSNGEIPIDNNLAERSVRPIVIGRKNFLFVGSEEGGRRATNCYTILLTAMNLGMDITEYLKIASQEMLNGNTNYHELTPRAILEKSKKL